MPAYTYKVRDAQGKVIQGQMEAVDDKDLRKKLDEQKYFIVSFQELRTAKDIWSIEIPFFKKKVTCRDLAVLCWQLFTMLDAGLPLIDALKIIERQTSNAILKSAVKKVGQRLEEGSSFSDALREHPEVFSRFFVQMVNAGEVGGVLDDIVKKLAVYYEHHYEVTGKVKSALTYPCLLLTVSCAVIVFLITFILPKFMAIFQDMGVPVPVLTQILLSAGTFLKENSTFVLALLGAAGVLFWSYGRTPGGRYKIDGLILKLPVMGELQRKMAAAQFCQTLASLVGGGIPILIALDVVTETIDNKVVVKAIKAVTAQVGEGKPIAKPLEDTGIFPIMVVSMIQAGEETGALDMMLLKTATFYEREINQVVENFTKMLEPLLIVLMTSVIGLIGISIFLPMTDLMDAMHQ